MTLVRSPLLALVGLAAIGLASLACGGRGEPWRIAKSDPATRRTAPAGAVLGGAGRYGSHAWLGIPFAKPPVGELRWRAPQPPERWAGVREALAFGAPCPQYASPFAGVDGRPGTIAGDEDCLTLDVWAPPFSPEDVPAGTARLPVMVWIHGGGNTIGTAAFYDGGNLAATHGVVVVAVQYRLGPLGWMRHEALRADAADDDERSGNFATLDLVRALEWVHDNIAAFGGDPGNVTIFGESAGGQNVYTLLLAPRAKGLFHRAISQSGGLWRSTPAQAEALADASPPGDAQSSGEILLRLLEQDGAGDRTAARAKLAGMRNEEIARMLRSKSASEILGAYTVQPSGMITMPKVFADGTVLPADDFDARFATADGWNRVPVILGTNRDENRLFLFPDPAHVRKLLWILPRFVDEKRTLATADHLSRMWKATGADGPAAAMRESERKVFVYRFDWDEEPTILGADLSKMLGASHGFEIPFVFGHFDLGRAANMIFTKHNLAGRESLSKVMMSYWAAFARNGDPGSGALGELPAWTAWDPSAPAAPKFIVFDTREGGGIRMASQTETPAQVIASVDTDPRLSTPAERCDVLRALADWGRGYTARQYAERSDCREYPLATVAAQ
ncbi:MAG: carboxylesterase family protein [Deltaproteobacteria bacterium]|nr:carboxylesterase family protein [Deltaproteobacteria bacterium]